MRWWNDEIEAALEWFDATHRKVGKTWTRIALPRAGGLGEQDARLMAMLDVILEEERRMTTKEPAPQV